MYRMMELNKDSLFKRIQQIQFMVIELHLYLDTHPCDARALMEYNCYAQQLMMLKRQYEMQHGPIDSDSPNTGQQTWKWIYEPWPWENEYCEEVQHVGL